VDRLDDGWRLRTWRWRSAAHIDREVVGGCQIYGIPIHGCILSLGLDLGLGAQTEFGVGGRTGADPVL
jgi:hypothetical protein